MTTTPAWEVTFDGDDHVVERMMTLPPLDGRKVAEFLAAAQSVLEAHVSPPSPFIERRSVVERASAEELRDAAAVIDAAREWVERHGWTRAKLRSDYGEVCMVGALYAVQGDVVTAAAPVPVRVWLPQELVLLGISAVMGDGVMRHSIPRWNDEPGRTVEDVLLAFKLAAEHARDRSRRVPRRRGGRRVTRRVAEQTVRDLERARELLRRDGWCQGRFWRRDGSRCALGALSAAACVGATDHSADVRYQRGRRALNAVLPEDVEVMSWNDEVGRTKRQVIGAFDRAVSAVRTGKVDLS